MSIWGLLINIAFLNQTYLIQREVIGALRRLGGVRLIVIDVVSHPNAEQAAKIVSILEENGCSMLFTVNEFGIDAFGVMNTYLEAKKMVHVNWSVDDPFFEELILQRKFKPLPLRFDFVSDKGYLVPMQERGYQPFFLPLATDPAIFHPEENVEKEWDVIFVGNSYLKQMDEFLEQCPDFITTLTPFLGKLINRYVTEIDFPVEKLVARQLDNVRIPAGMTKEKARFIAKHAAGYFGRRNLVVALVKRYKGFKVFGDAGWTREIGADRLGRAKYYDNLNNVYNKAKIVIDINRIVIRNGFTQRAFDVPASGAFLLTSSKPIVNDLFVTSGEEQNIAVFKSAAELYAGIDYYLSHESERKDIAARGMETVLGFHTYDHRIAEIFRVLSQRLKSGS